MRSSSFKLHPKEDNYPYRVKKIKSEHLEFSKKRNNFELRLTCVIELGYEYEIIEHRIKTFRVKDGFELKKISRIIGDDCLLSRITLNKFKERCTNGC